MEFDSLVRKRAVIDHRCAESAQARPREGIEKHFETRSRKEDKSDQRECVDRHQVSEDGVLARDGLPEGKLPRLQFHQFFFRKWRQCCGGRTHSLSDFRHTKFGEQRPMYLFLEIYPP